MRQCEVESEVECRSPPSSYVNLCLEKALDSQVFVFPCSAYKYLHVALQTAAGIFILLGIIFIGLFKHYSHEDQFFSVHSWLGAIAIAMYIAQYTAGAPFRASASIALNPCPQA